MSKPFSILAPMMNDESKKLADNSFTIVKIPFDDILPSTHNKYTVDDVELLAESIGSRELDQNFVVRPGDNEHFEENGKYVLLSGHRRRLAIAHIRETQPERYQFIPCKVRYDIKNENQEIIALVDGNGTGRDQEPDKTMYEIYKDLKEAIDGEIANGNLKVEGRKRAYMSCLLKLSQTQIQRLQSIDRYLIPELKEKFQKGEISLQVASTISRLPEKKQYEAEKNLIEKAANPNPQQAEKQGTSDETGDSPKDESDKAGLLDPGVAPESKELLENQDSQDSNKKANPETPADPEIPQDSEYPGADDEEDPEKNFIRLTSNDLLPIKKALGHIKTVMNMADYIDISPNNRKAIYKDIKSLNKISKDIMKRIS